MNLLSNTLSRRLCSCALATLAASVWPLEAGAQPEAPARGMGPTVEAKIVAQAPNAIENGDFETLDAASQPSGWSLSQGVPAAQSATRLAEEGGNHYVQLKAVGEGEARKISRQVLVQPGWKSLKVTARVRGKGLRSGPEEYEDAHIGLVFFNAGNTEVGYAIPITLSADSDWTVLSAAGEVPPEAHHVVLDAGNGGVGGEFDVDDIVLEPNAMIDAPPLREGFPEGSFEETDGQGQPQGWPISGKAHIERLEENGEHFLRLSNALTEQSVELSTLWKLDPDARRVRLQALMRTQGLRPGPQPWENARLSPIFLDASGVRIGDWPPSLELKANSAWASLSTQALPIPRGAVFLKIYLGLLNTRGTLGVDDIQIQQLK